LDSSVRVYVANIGTDTVTAFPAYPAAGNEAPFATISNAAITAPTGIALDSSGRIYISNGSNPGQILVFAANPVGNVTGAPIATLTSGLGENQLLTAR
jgi:sugar lactone lactonase YvrE